MKFIKKNNHLLIIVVVSASTEAQFRGEQVVVDVGELVRPLVSVHRLVLLLPQVQDQVQVKNLVVPPLL